MFRIEADSDTRLHKLDVRFLRTGRGTNNSITAWSRQFAFAFVGYEGVFVSSESFIKKSAGGVFPRWKNSC